MTSSKDPQKMTPVMRQYQTAKQSHPDAIVFFRMGDFYEMFFEDAVVAARELELTLTSRNKGDPDEVPMAGVPHHAAHSYVSRLISAGYKVAICEQMGDPSKIKGIVPREVVRVLTPGLITSEDQLEPRANNFLGAVEKSDSHQGLALLDLSTGEMLSAQLPDITATVAELTRMTPREILVDKNWPDLRPLIEQLLPSASLREDPPIDEQEARALLEEVLPPQTAKETLASLCAPCLKACGRTLRMAIACNPGRPLPVQRIITLDPSSLLQIDSIAQTHLELLKSSDGSKRGALISVIDKTVTSPGARLLRKWLLSPLVDVPSIRRRQDAVESFVLDPIARQDLRSILKEIGDLERLAVRAVLGEATPKDLGILRDSLLAVPRALDTVSKMTEPNAKESLAHFGWPSDSLEDLASLLDASLVDQPPALARDGGIFRQGFDAELDETERLQREGTDLIIALEAGLRAETGITTLKVKFTRVFGWYVEVTKPNMSRVPSQWRRKQTVASGERFTTDQLDDLADRLLHARESHAQRETNLFEDLIQRVAEKAPALRTLGHLLATWDVFSALAEVAHALDYNRPTVDEGDIIDIRDGRHPVVERLAAAGRFVPNDVRLDGNDERLWLITGPNMAGKSTLMRQVAHIVLLAQTGSFVPARSAHIGVVDRILSRVGAGDNVSAGESTFMVEMRETASILRQATSRSLVILDEIGRGTSTYDGLAIAWAVAEHLHDVVRCRTMFATHYHELTEFADQATCAANHSVSARERGDDIVFLYKLIKGAASRSYGVAVAKLAGINETVLARARAILTSLESGSSLPGGRHATLRGRTRQGGVQLDLFAPPPAPCPEPHPAIETLRNLDPNRLTPLDALQLITKLRAMVDEEP